MSIGTQKVSTFIDLKSHDDDILSTLRVCYLHSDYKSLTRAAKAYIGVISTLCRVVLDPSAADIVILHDEPHKLPMYFKRYAALKAKYVVAYAVWEASELPMESAIGLNQVQEVWTCSEYCKNVLAKYHLNTHLVPHIVERDFSFAPEDFDRVSKAIRYDKNNYYFLSIAGWWNRRKNIPGIIEAFRRIRARAPSSRLILKLEDGENLPLALQCSQIICISEEFSEAEINCLYFVADAYISLHHSEGWGFCLSDALLCRLSLLVPDYSGSLEYASQSNAFLVRSREAFILPEDCFHLFDTNMKWSYPDYEDAARIMLDLAVGRYKSEQAVKIENGLLALARFTRRAISEIIASQLHLIRRRLRDGAPKVLYLGE